MIAPLLGFPWVWNRAIAGGRHAAARPPCRDAFDASHQPSVRSAPALQAPTGIFQFELKPSPGGRGVSDDNTTELQRLIDQMCAGGARSPATVDALVERVYARTGRLARRIFRGSFPRLGATHETGTVHHEALLKIRRALLRSPPATVREFWALSTCIIRHTLFDLARRYDRSPRRKAQRLDTPGGSSRHAKRSPEPVIRDESPEVVERWTQLHNRVSRLPGPQRDVFELCFYNGLSQREAAAVLDCDPATVNRLWRRAIAELPPLDL
jgi:RNA polymerase sigma factor (sigma-70 family)